LYTDKYLGLHQIWTIENGKIIQIWTLQNYVQPSVDHCIPKIHHLLTPLVHNSLLIGSNFSRSILALIGVTFGLSQKFQQSKKVTLEIWSSTFIPQILTYTSSLLSFRNRVLHRHTLKEKRAKQLEYMYAVISTTYNVLNLQWFYIKA
jgi:hypothetical protein